MVSSVGGSPASQQTPQASGSDTSVGAIKRSLDVEKQAGEALVAMIDDSSPHKGNSIDIKA